MQTGGETIIDDPPFSLGDILALTGPGVGLHLHRAGKPTQSGGIWNNGHRPWGKDHKGITLRHATKLDVMRLMRIALEDFQRLASRIEQLREFEKQIQERGENAPIGSTSYLSTRRAVERARRNTGRPNWGI
jgi:hypothetical protein